MCLIIHQPRGVTLPAATLRSAAQRNPDGFGVMYAERGRLVIHRTLNADEALRLYRAHAAGRECVLHWRMTTHGATDLANCHPFEVAPDGSVAVVHNGVLDVATPRAGLSDTWHFAAHILAPMVAQDRGALFDAERVAVLEQLIGSGNKLVAMNAQGRVSIIGRSRGVIYGRCWYSNTYGWDAPAHLSAALGWSRYHQRAHSFAGWWGDDLDTYTDARGGTVALTTTTPDTPTESGGHAAPGRRWSEELLDAHADGSMAFAQWVEEHPAPAARALADWYDLTEEEARQLAEEHPESVADWLAELIEAAD